MHIGLTIDDSYEYFPEYYPEDDLLFLEAETVRRDYNFTCFNVDVASDENGYYPLSGTVYSDDEDISDDDLYQRRQQRDHILQKALLDCDFVV